MLLGYVIDLLLLYYWRAVPGGIKECIIEDMTNKVT